MTSEHLITLDWETWYSPIYTLKKLSPTEYIRDPRFHSHGVAVKLDGGETRWYPHETLKKADLPWRSSTVVSHNALFDMLILTERFKITPRAYSDTLGMARAVLMQMPNYKLDTLAKLLLGKSKMLGQSGESLVAIAKNRDLKEDSRDMNLLAKYAIEDAELCYQLYMLMTDALPPLEHKVLSISTRWFAEPRLELDTSLLKAIAEDIETSTEQLVVDSEWTREELSSNQQFVARIERDYGIEFPWKTSQRTGQPTPATGKSDPEYIELTTSHPELENVWRAREAVKSTQQTSRIKTFLNIAALAPDPEKPTLPVPLAYCMAQTHRWAGTGKINMQNLPQLRSSRLRKAIVAPENHVIVVADSAQIELRINMWFCGQNDVLKVLSEGGDIYKLMAARHYAIDEAEVTKNQRSFGKVCELGLGFGMGAQRFGHTCASGPMGMPPMILPEGEAQRAVDMYRATHPAVTAMWKLLDNVILKMALPNEETTPEYNAISREALGQGARLEVLGIEYQKIVLPDGMPLWYSHLSQIEETGNWYYGQAPRRYTLYGAKLLENICQALARSIIAEQIVKCEKAGLRTVSSTHDEILVVAPSRKADKSLEKMIKIMSTSPKWCESLQLSAEGGYDRSYSK